MSISAEFDHQSGPLSSSRSLSARLRGWRNGLIANPDIRRLLARLPLVRHIVRAKANRLYALTTGFVQSQVLFACVELGIFETLSKGPATTSALSGKTGIDPVRLATLLRSADCAGLITTDKAGLWSLDDLGAVVCSDDGLGDMIRHHALLYRDPSDPVALISGNGAQSETARFWSYVHTPEKLGIPDADADAYSRLMATSQASVAAEIVESYPFSSHDVVLDVGGGHGAFLQAVGRTHARPELWLFDVPPVAKQATHYLEDAGFATRARISGGNFFTDALPAGADCVTLVRILYDHDDATALRLLRNIRASIADDATLVIAEPMAGPDPARQLVGAYFAMYLMAMGSGKCRTPKEIFALLQDAGFTSFQEKRTVQPLFSSLVTARP